MSPSLEQQQNFEPTVMPTYFPTQGPTISSSPTLLLIDGGTYDNASSSPSPSVVMNSSSSASPSPTPTSSSVSVPSSGSNYTDTITTGLPTGIVSAAPSYISSSNLTTGGAYNTTNQLTVNYHDR